MTVRPPPPHGYLPSAGGSAAGRSLGEGGTCGREEIDIIQPAVKELNDEGLPIQGPFPADTIFLKARDGALDSLVTDEVASLLMLPIGLAMRQVA